MTNREKEFIGFISFAEPDKELAENIHFLFKELGYKTFFSKKQLTEVGGTEWRKEVINGIKNSTCIIPICTQKSINRKWVLFELGAAEALGLDRFPARVAGVKIDEMNLPGVDVTVYDLYNKEQLTQFLVNICEKDNKYKSKNELVSFIETQVLINPRIENIITQSKKRWIFIAGNDAKSDDTERLKMFLENLSVALLKKGFSISSCPQVESVGKVVAQKTTDWIVENSDDSSSEFKIGGIYPIDRETRKSKSLSTRLQDQWLQHLLAFRKSYLIDQEWLILIGGHEGTFEEYNAAHDLNVKKYLIPCFGGTAEELWISKKSERMGPCNDCNYKSKKCDTKEISEKIAEYLSESYKTSGKI